MASESEEGEKFYLVGRYDLYVTTVRVRAKSLADAIIGVSNGGGETWGDPEYIETASNYGMPIEPLEEEIFEALCAATGSPVDLNGGYVVGIASGELDPNQ